MFHSQKEVNWKIKNDYSLSACAWQLKQTHITAIRYMRECMKMVRNAIEGNSPLKFAVL